MELLSGHKIEVDWENASSVHDLRESNTKLREEIIQKNAEIVALEEAISTLHVELKNWNRYVQKKKKKKKKRELEKYRQNHQSPVKVVEPLRRGGGHDNGAATLPPASTLPVVCTDDWKEKHDKLSKKVVSAKIEINSLKHQICQLQQIIKREVNWEELSIHDLLKKASEGTWKGRAEQIVKLKDKNDVCCCFFFFFFFLQLQMKEELEKMKGSYANNSGDSDFKKKNKEQLSAVAEYRVKQFESTQKELEKTASKIELLEKKIRGKNSRIEAVR
ncbi:hypothetical protein RFI_08435 [Reticulomyxa filosa]|uniref:Uncharacterized protein n=1 Tax=Reticulomyxa filosa TaxID=46433 RepID=X6NSG5_RETFI|nr:hypothetical protein RFI_08435 [Reticulomyxa filosa]|eukprot:ETO28694.1 hypothetical protein RFI_08435 [Reticulomyxa filosa]